MGITDTGTATILYASLVAMTGSIVGLFLGLEVAAIKSPFVVTHGLMHSEPVVGIN